jgi:hypothetical protein
LLFLLCLTKFPEEVKRYRMLTVEFKNKLGCEVCMVFANKIIEFIDNCKRSVLKVRSTRFTSPWALHSQIVT